MADPIVVKVSDLTELTSLATGDLFEVVDISEAAAADKTKKIQAGNIKVFNADQVAEGILTLSKMAANSADSDQYVDGSIDAVHIAAMTSAQLAAIISNETGSGALAFATSPTLVTPLLGTPTSGVLTNCTGLPRAGIVADAIDDTLIADDVVNSEHYVAGSIDLEHMSANSIDSDQYVDGSIDQEHLSVGASKVTNRQGGSATDWHTTGTTNYAVASARMQAGSAVSGAIGAIDVTFPVAFSAAPIVLLTSGFSTAVVSVTGTYTDSFAGSILIDGYGTSGKTVFWLAIGPA